MKAVQLIAHGTPGTFELCDVPEPTPAADEVVVQVQSCGLNHLDLWLEEGGLPVPVPLPRTPGGEVAGRILAVGAAVKGWQPGDEVAVQSNLFCGECEFCRRGEESLCLRGQLLGVQRDGGFAEKVVVPARVLVRLPAGVDFDTVRRAHAGGQHRHAHADQSRAGASRRLGAGDGRRERRRFGGDTDRQRAWARASSAPVRAKPSVSCAKHLGADFVVDTNDPDWPAEVRRITEKRGVDFVVEHIGGDVLPKVFECLARGGTVVTCGATAGREVTLNLWPFFVKQHRLIGSYGRNRADIEATLEWAAAGKLKPVIDSIFPLERTGEAFAHLRSRNFLGKVLVEPYEPVSESD